MFHFPYCIKLYTSAFAVPGFILLYVRGRTNQLRGEAPALLAWGI